MRKASLLPALVLGAMAPLAFAQSAGMSGDVSADAPATPLADIPADTIDDPSRTPRKSAFGRVMGLMTQLLQEAGTRPADPDAPGLITSFENAGITVRVTPVRAPPIDNDAQLAVRAGKHGKAPPAPL